MQTFLDPNHGFSAYAPISPLASSGHTYSAIPYYITEYRCLDEIEGCKWPALNPWYNVDTSGGLKHLRLSLEQPAAGQAQHTKQFLMEQTW